MPRKPIIKTCPICNTEHHRRGETCSTECANTKRAKTASETPLTCHHCGEEFYSKDGTGKYCNNTHYRTCLICEEKFIVEKPKLSKKTPTCGPKCGAIYTHRSEENKKKRRENSLSKWGVEHPFQSAEIKTRIQDKLIGTAGRFGTDASKEAIKHIYGVENVSELEFIKKKKAETYDKNYTSKGLHPAGGPVSKTNLRWKKLLEDTTGVTWQLEKYFDEVGRVDLYTEHNGRRIAVEVNPTATHNVYVNVKVCYSKHCVLPCTEHTVKKMQHHERAKTLKEKHDVSLTTIFDWMDEKKTLSFIKAYLRLNERKVYAKHTTVKPVTQREANKFFQQYHMLGGSRKQTYCYGIYYDDELLQVQSFSPIGKEEGVFEAKRLATKTGVTIVGGVSKGTKHFMNEVNPQKIIAFSDLNLSWPEYDVKFNGFTRTVINKPQKCWSKKDKMILDKSAARQSADRLLGLAENSTTSIYPEDWSNEQVFLAEGWLPVWDCGMIKDEWVNPKTV